MGLRLDLDHASSLTIASFIIPCICSTSTSFFVAFILAISSSEYQSLLFLINVTPARSNVLRARRGAWVAENSTFGFYIYAELCRDCNSFCEFASSYLSLFGALNCCERRTRRV